MTGYYDKYGFQIHAETSATLIEDKGGERRAPYRLVARTEVRQQVVLTVWLGIDHGWGRTEAGPPIIFETIMVFPTDSLEESYCRRYATLEDALRGHAQTVELLRTGMLR